MQASALPGTAGARDPFFSPTGEWVAFFADGKLKKVALTGSAPITLGDAANPRGGAWSTEDDSIVFQPINAAGVNVGALMRVPASGGTAARLIPLSGGDGNWATCKEFVLWYRRQIPEKYALHLFNSSSTDNLIISSQTATDDIERFISQK
jgi:hypothetical protein